ncbi:glycerol-3-phosphate cytidylyltransferase, partial [Lactococcus lactis]|nr:glycerol-3-phosphate cytidylyltransferase [Lactococcus lactis]
LYIDMFDVDVFAMGDDWRGKFDVLKEQFPNLKTMYFPRGKTSSSKIKEDLWKLYQEKQNIK